MEELTLVTRDDDAGRRLPTAAATNAETHSLRASTEKQWEVSDRNAISQPALGRLIKPDTPLAEPPLSPPDM